MIFKIHWTIHRIETIGDDFEDSIIVDGEDVKDIQKQVKDLTDSGRIPKNATNLWSEEIK